MIVIEGSKWKYWIGILSSLFLGMTFIVAGMGKWFAGVVEFELLAFPSFLPAPLATAFFTWLPRVELVIGIALVVGVAVKFATCLSLPLIAGFTINNFILFTRGLGNNPCGCFGMGNKMSVEGSLYLDSVMIACAIMILLYHRGKFFNKKPWFWR